MDLPSRIDAVWAFLDAGDANAALDSARGLHEDHPEDPWVLLARTAAAYFAELAGEALDSAREAERLLTVRTPETDHPGGEPADGDTENALRGARTWRAYAAFRLWAFDEAEAAARRALGKEGSDPELWDLLARIMERTGRTDEAEEADRKASGLDPAAFPLPNRLTDRELDAAVEEAVARLPGVFQEVLDATPVVVEPFPSRELAESPFEDEPPLPPDILGLFTGTSMMDRSVFNPLERPGTIFLFKGNLERECPDRKTLISEIEITLYHELAHYLGFDEDDMEDLGLA
ncbi:MAG: metallopeptidase family protein [bacterium]